jgi:hypothetical protein
MKNLPAAFFLLFYELDICLGSVRGLRDVVRTSCEVVESFRMFEAFEARLSNL